MSERDKKKQIAKISVFITSIFVIFLSVSYAFISRTIEGNKQVIVNAGVLDLILNEDNEITISDALPMYDEVGIIQEENYIFRLVNNTENATNYVLKLNKVETSDLSENLVKYGLVKDGQATIELLSSLTNGIIDQGTIAGGATINYELRLWIDSSVTDKTLITGKTLTYTLSVEGNQQVEESTVYQDNSGANIPELTSGMIPVTYDGENWIKADISEKWYDYDAQMWANAVTVTEDTRDAYITADVGTEILMEDINTMWVWIPRYEYQYTDLSTSYAGGTQTEPGEIKINFISKDTTTPSDSNTYQIPEGFKFGDENISGFWMAKFETSTLEECTATTDDIDTGCDLSTLTPQVKPGVTSWRGARISTFFQASRLMQSSSNASTYGFDIEGTGTMDVHMLKNSEWGIVAMLSQSNYGKYGNTAYDGVNKEVYQNKSSSYITGMSNGTSSSSTTNTQATYDTPDTGYGASASGTIYGVYDMSGGGYEYVMGNYNNYSGRASSNSGFCGTNGPTDGTCREWPNAKYFDLYTSSPASTGYKFGDATYETSGWYSDYAGLIDPNSPWFRRGGYYGNSTSAGVFDFSGDNGSSIALNASRFAIKP